MPVSRTPEGESAKCPVCGREFYLETSSSGGDAPCPHCGTRFWYPSLWLSKSRSAYLPDGVVIHELSAQTQVDAVRELVNIVVQLNCLPAGSVDEVVDQVLHREQLGSTAVGGGYAVPHARVDNVEKIACVIGHAAAGIPFDDSGEVVQTLVLLLSPTNQPAEHLRALDRIARALRRVI